jgi:RNA polymerase sigma factor (TIGR02999 family)
MSDVTQILDAIERGEKYAAQELLPRVYDELRNLAARQLAQKKPEQTLQPTALVHEAYLRLVGPANADGFTNRRHFFSAAAEAMRRIIIDQARRKLRIKHGGGKQPFESMDLPMRRFLDLHELITLNEALDQLTRASPRRAELVKLRYFLGYTVAEAAQLLNISHATAEEDWRFAKAWLYLRLQETQEST